MDPCGTNSISLPPNIDSKKLEFIYKFGNKFLLLASSSLSINWVWSLKYFFIISFLKKSLYSSGVNFNGSATSISPIFDWYI